MVYCIVYFPPNFQTCWNTVYLLIGLLYRTSNDNFNKSKNSPITAATEWYSAVRLVRWMNEPSCRRQRHWISCSSPTWINSARIPVITNPSFYFSLRQGRRKGNIERVNAILSVTQGEDGGRSQKSHLNIDFGKPQPERLFTALA